MLIIPEIVRVARKPKQVETVPTTLTLIAASFDGATETLSMTFDRAVLIGGYDGGQTLVNVPTIGSLYAADIHVTLSSDGRTLTAECEVLESASGTRTWLTVPANSGIVDAESGVAWAGVTEWAL